MPFTSQQAVIWQTCRRKPAVIPIRQQAGRKMPFTGQQAVIRQTGSRKPAVNSFQATGRQGDTFHWSAGSYHAAIR